MSARNLLAVALFGSLAYAVYKATQGNFFTPFAPAAGDAATNSYAAAGVNSVSPQGMALVQGEEGLSLTAYPDGGGYSIGYGHHITGSDGLSSSSKITQAQADQFLQSDIASAVATINSAVRVPLDQNQFDALVDFVYNEGASHFLGSTLLSDLNAGDYASAAAQFEVWNIANGAKNDVLTARRATEQSLFDTV